MPALIIRTNSSLTPEQKKEASVALSRIISECTGKPIDYIMVVIHDNVSICFAGDPEAKAVFMEFMSIGCISKAANKKTSSALTKYMGELGFAGDRIYISFTNKDGADWGYNGSTFA